MLAERIATAREPIDPQRVMAALERELAPLLVDPLVLVLDDAETLDGAPGALAVVGRLLAAEARALRLAVAARHRLALRTARGRAAGRLTEIGPAELAFSAADCAEFIRVATGREASADEVDDLMTATEGWRQFCSSGLRPPSSSTPGRRPAWRR